VPAVTPTPVPTVPAARVPVSVEKSCHLISLRSLVQTPHPVRQPWRHLP
jgi:hypothetical protein